ncbi:hypothetical protein PCE1_002479 [Barthelona sp. PCE]
MPNYCPFALRELNLHRILSTYEVFDAFAFSPELCLFCCVTNYTRLLVFTFNGTLLFTKNLSESACQSKRSIAHKNGKFYILAENRVFVYENFDVSILCECNSTEYQGIAIDDSCNVYLNTKNEIYAYKSSWLPFAKEFKSVFRLNDQFCIENVHFIDNDHLYVATSGYVKVLHKFHVLKTIGNSGTSEKPMHSHFVDRFAFLSYNSCYFYMDFDVSRSKIGEFKVFKFEEELFPFFIADFQLCGFTRQVDGSLSFLINNREYTFDASNLGELYAPFLHFSDINAPTKGCLDVFLLSKRGVSVLHSKRFPLTLADDMQTNNAHLLNNHRSIQLEFAFSSSVQQWVQSAHQSAIQNIMDHVYPFTSVYFRRIFTDTVIGAGKFHLVADAISASDIQPESVAKLHTNIMQLWGEFEFEIISDVLKKFSSRLDIPELLNTLTVATATLLMNASTYTFAQLEDEHPWIRRIKNKSLRSSIDILLFQHAIHTHSDISIRQGAMDLLIECYDICFEDYKEEVLILSIANELHCCGKHIDLFHSELPQYLGHKSHWSWHLKLACLDHLRTYLSDTHIFDVILNSDGFIVATFYMLLFDTAHDEAFGFAFLKHVTFSDVAITSAYHNMMFGVALKLKDVKFAEYLLERSYWLCYHKCAQYLMIHRNDSSEMDRLKMIIDSKRSESM